MPAAHPERLADAPRLRAIFRCAGTVRTFVTDEVWRRRILVTTADDDENAVAEFTWPRPSSPEGRRAVPAQEARGHRWLERLVENAPPGQQRA